MSGGDPPAGRPVDAARGGSHGRRGSPDSRPAAPAYVARMDRPPADDDRPGRAHPPAVRPGAADVRLALLLAVIVVVGVPFVAILWETLNALLSGHIQPRRLLLSAPLLIVFLAILTVAGRALGRHDRSS